MCCIFTCCGWMIDLIQRLWTFTMSCCISSAVCCALVTASMSGIALGYNYSLAEYIDLKETNVSVYLKRGVFDDEISDDMDWRRSGRHMPVSGHLRDSNLMTGAPENEEMPLRSGRRLDDSVVVSDDQQKFEGSLMRLTVKPPSAPKSTPEPLKSDDKMAEVIKQYQDGSINQAKALHSLLNQRNQFTQRHTAKIQDASGKQPVEIDLEGRRYGGTAPGGIAMFGGGPYATEKSRRLNDVIGPDVPMNLKPYNDPKFAVPGPNIGEPANWILPKDLPESFRKSFMKEKGLDMYATYTYPPAIRFTPDLPRPSRPKSTHKPTFTTLREQDVILQGPERDIIKNKILSNKEDLIRFNKQKEKSQKDYSEEDYEEQANKGIPMRKKRDTSDYISVTGDSFRLNRASIKTLIDFANNIKVKSSNRNVIFEKNKSASFSYNLKNQTDTEK